MTVSGMKRASSGVNIFHLVGIFVLLERLKDTSCVSLEGEPGPCPKAALLLLDCSSLVFSFPD